MNHSTSLLEGASKYLILDTNASQIFDHAANDQLVGTVTGLSRGVFTVDFSPSAEVRFSVATVTKMREENRSVSRKTTGDR